MSRLHGVRWPTRQDKEQVMEAFQQVGLTFGWHVVSWVLIALFAVVIAAAIFWWPRRDDSWSDAGLGLGFASVIFGIAVLSTVIAWFILPGANRHNYTVSGTVTDVSNTLVTGSGGITGGYAFHLDTVDGTLWSSDDRMIAAVGHEIDLVCTLEWVPNAGDYYNCRPARDLP